MILIFRFIGAVILVVVSGCASMPQAVVIKPKVDGPISDVGAGKALLLNVVDERPHQTLGTRGTNFGADLTIEGDLTSIVRSVLADGLSRQSFKLSPSVSSQQSELHVEIRTLDYTVMNGLFSGTLRIDVGLKGICIQGTARPYEKLYSAEIVKSIQQMLFAEENNQYISAAVSESLKSLLSDEQLMECLAHPVSNP